MPGGSTEVMGSEGSNEVPSLAYAVVLSST